jgi:hypothetical protein
MQLVSAQAALPSPAGRLISRPLGGPLAAIRARSDESDFAASGRRQTDYGSRASSVWDTRFKTQQSIGLSGQSRFVKEFTHGYFTQETHDPIAGGNTGGLRCPDFLNGRATHNVGSEHKHAGFFDSRAADSNSHPEPAYLAGRG